MQRHRSVLSLVPGILGFMRWGGFTRIPGRVQGRRDPMPGEAGLMESAGPVLTRSWRTCDIIATSPNLVGFDFIPALPAWRGVRAAVDFP